MGRTDFMVKIRGYSVELGAVEAAIEEDLAVRACVVSPMAKRERINASSPISSPL